MASILWNSIVLSFFFTLNGGTQVKWSISLPGECVASDTMSGVCTRSRTVQCVKTLSGQIIPDYYCNNVSTKPPPFIKCDTPKCAKRCVVSMWSSWEPCDVACLRKFSYRTRSLLWRDNDAVTCPPLFEKSPCSKCAGNSNEFYLWEVGDWGKCRAFTMVQVYQQNINQSHVLPSGSDVCGPDLKIGKATRKVRCIDANGVEKEAKKCLNSKDKDGRITQRPDRSKVCELSCDCHVSAWSQWNGCPADCSRTEESRTRGVLYPPRLGGKGCGPLVETRPCTTKCPSYKWYTSPWGECEVSMNGTLCDNGFKDRVVFCVDSNSAVKANETVPVGDHLCDITTKSVSRQLCERPCPRDCVVSAWGAWESCSITCGGVGMKRRTRSIVKTASQNGMDCPSLIQVSSCEMPPCIDWFVAPFWGPCFPRAHCGPGNKFRLVYCHKLSSTSGWTDPKFCTQSKPMHIMNCTKPCPNDCVLSEWEEWGPCSKSCGDDGGVQTRKRTILAYPGFTRPPCPSADKLTETQKCNVGKQCADEAVLMWKMNAWQPCKPSNISCGPGAGIQVREVHCGNDIKNFSNDTMCGNITKPSVTRMCDIPCPKDCVLSKWAHWSKCNATCELTGTQISKRYVLQRAENGGRVCPVRLVNGVERKSRQCVNNQPCYNYTWEVTPWNVCEILPQMKLKPTICGAGYQTRNISCMRSDGKLVETSYCFESNLELPPKTLKECWMPCDEHCVRTSWTEWSQCPKECTTRKAVRHRSRQVVNLSPARGGFGTDCPSLTHKDFQQTEDCPKIPCKSYSWFAAPYASCIPYNSLTSCGQGRKQRHVLCQDQTDMNFVDESFCDKVKKPSVRESCYINCTQDCVVSSWGEWDLKCFNTCGNSLKTRQRTVLKQPVGLGRACPSLVDKQLCQEPSCISFKWSVGAWNACALASPGSTCGNGTQTRKVVCTPDPTREWICAKRAEKPPVVQECSLPCPGDCVVSPWSTWSDCVQGREYCSKIRRRKQARKAHMTSTNQCSSYELEEKKNCTCPSSGKLVTSNWTTCSLNQTAEQYCGKGTEYRSVKCEGENEIALDSMWCKNIVNTPSSRDCEIPCRVDCIMGDWSEWSGCSAACGKDGMMKRTRTVIASGKNGGRKCPEDTQSIPCNNIPCYTYHLNEGNWGKCYVDGQGCGQGVQSRETTCLRSDGKIVSLHFCFGQSSDDKTKLKLLQVVVNNSSQLLMKTSRTCDESCPGDCDMSLWSKWSECGKNCFGNSSKYSQTRTRVIISQPDAGGKACSSELLQTRVCQLMNAAVDPMKCIGARWRSGTWKTNGTREVWCETSSGVKVTGACAAQNKPSETKLCSPACSDPNAICHEGQCVCKSNYEKFQRQCILTQGCLKDGHCIKEHTVCQNEKCSCKINYRWNATGLCVPAPQPSTDHSTLISSSNERTTVSTSIVSTSRKDTTSGTTEISKDTTSGTTEISKDTTSGTTEIPTEDVDKFPSVQKTTNSLTGKPSTTVRPEKEALDDRGMISPEFWKWIGLGAGALVFFLVLAIGFYCYTKRQRKAKHRMMKLKRNTIELVGVMTYADDYKSKPEKI